eukprot:s2501_g3.t1
MFSAFQCFLIFISILEKVNLNLAALLTFEGVIVETYTFLTDFQDGNCHCSTPLAEEESDCQTALVSSSNRTCSFEPLAVAAGLQDPKFASFKRPCLSSLYCSSDEFVRKFQQCAMEMLVMQATEKAQCGSVPNLPRSMAVRNGQIICTWIQERAAVTCTSPAVRSTVAQPSRSYRLVSCLDYFGWPRYEVTQGQTAKQFAQGKVTSERTARFTAATDGTSNDAADDANVPSSNAADTADGCSSDGTATDGHGSYGNETTTNAATRHSMGYVYDDKFYAGYAEHACDAFTYGYAHTECAESRRAPGLVPRSQESPGRIAQRYSAEDPKSDSQDQGTSDKRLALSSYATNFAEQEKRLQERIAEAKAHLVAAKEELDRGRIDADAVQEIHSDDEVGEVDPGAAAKINCREHARSCKLTAGTREGCRSFDGSRSTVQQKAKKGFTKDCGVKFVCCSYAFWSGWLTATSACSNRKPVSQIRLDYDPEYVLVMNWKHPILRHPTYCSPWAAIERARGLAFELGTYEAYGTREVALAQATPGTTLRPTTSKTVSPLMYKPNRAEDPQLLDPSDGSDTSPRRHRRDPRRPPFRQLPSWVSELWDILQESGVAEDPDEGPVLYLQSYFISHHYHRCERAGRVLRLDREYVDWAEEIMLIWEDVFDRRAPFSLHLVQPEPPFDLARGAAGNVVIVQHPVPGRTACLTISVFSEFPMRIEGAAHSMETWMQPSQIILLGNAMEECAFLERNGHDRCVIRAGHRVYQGTHAIRTFDGLGLVIRIPAPFEADVWERQVQAALQLRNNPGGDVNDEVTLMARSAVLHTLPDRSRSVSRESSQSSSPSLSGASRSQTSEEDVDRQVRRVDVPWSFGDRLNGEVARAFGIETADVFRVIFVQHRPDDLVDEDLQCLLLWRRCDTPVADFLRLVLVDLEYHEDAHNPRHRIDRKAAWVPSRITKLSLFRLFGFAGHCELHEEQCEVWRNDQFVDAHGTTILTFTHGDFALLLLPYNPEGDECLEAASGTSGIPSLHLSDFSDGSSLLQTVGSVDQSVSMQKFRSPISAYPSSVCAVERAPLDGHPNPWMPFHPELALLTQLWDRPQLHRRGLQNEAVMHFETWYLNDGAWQRCPTSRSVALPAAVHLWHALLRQVWRDRYVVGAPARLVVVHPEVHPQHHGGHLLLVQSDPTLHGLLLSTSWALSGHRRFQCVAQLAPSYVPYEDLLQAHQLGSLCYHPRIQCEGSYGEVSIPVGQPWLARDGQHLHFDLHEDASLPDHSMLMQISLQSLPSQAALDLPLEPGECQPFHFDALAPSFTPGGGALLQQSDFIQDLFVIWRAVAASWENEAPSSTFVTWLVNHDWADHIHCFAPRLISLSLSLSLKFLNVGKKIFSDFGKTF